MKPIPSRSLVRSSDHGSQVDQPDLARAAKSAVESLELRRLLSTTALPAGHFVGDGHDHGAHGGGCSCGCCAGAQTAEMTVPANVQPFVTERGSDFFVDVSGETVMLDPLIGDNVGDDIFRPYGPASYDTYAAAGLAGLVGSTGSDVIDDTTAPAFSSNPGASTTILLDFDGHVVADTLWNQFNNGNDIHAEPYDTDGDLTSFNGSEVQAIRQTFERVAEDFSAWDVNVTTVDPQDGTFAAGGDGIRVIMSSDYDSSAAGGTGNRWYNGAGGVAYLNSWYWTGDTPVWAFTNNLGSSKGFAEAASHEVGHAFGLRHDGTSDVGYYRGHGEGDVGWASLMGVGYYENLTQWSKGEYNDANNLEDDLAIITQGVEYRVDDHADSLGGGTTLSVATTGDTGTFEASGNIEQTSDRDSFRLVMASDGTADISVLGDLYTNLDAQLTVYNSSGGVVAVSDNPANSDAFLNVPLDAGTYYLTVDGVGWGDPLDTGYTDYGSLGEYELIGSIIFEDTTSDFVVDVNGAGLAVEQADVRSYSNQDAPDSAFSIVDNGINLAGNTWKRIALDYDVTFATAITATVSVADLGEIVGIGLDTDNSHVTGRNLFALGGTQRWGGMINDFRDTGLSSGDTVTVTLPVGEYYTGNINNLVLISDDDLTRDADTTFTDIRIFERDIDQPYDVTLQAESFASQSAGSTGSTWSVVSPPGAVGTAVQAGPNVGVNTGDNTNGPRLDYTINVPRAGTYYAAVRMIGGSNVDDSVHLGINGTAFTTGGYGLSQTSDGFVWADRIPAKSGDNRASFTVSEPGTYTLNLWMREDGVVVDSIAISDTPIPAGGPGAGNAPAASLTFAGRSGFGGLFSNRLVGSFDRLIDNLF